MAQQQGRAGGARPRPAQQQRPAGPPPSKEPGTERECLACKRTIRFAAGPAGGVLPLERLGTVYVLTEGGAQAAKLDHPVASELYVSHFATCPQASRFSKRARPPAQPHA